MQPEEWAKGVGGGKEGGKKAACCESVSEWARV